MEKLLLTDEVRKGYRFSLRSLFARKMVEATSEPAHSRGSRNDSPSNVVHENDAEPKRPGSIWSFFQSFGRSSDGKGRASRQTPTFDYRSPATLAKGRRKFALGLTWATYDDDVSMKEVMEANPVTGEPPDLKVVIKGKRQVGLTRRAQGVRQGMPAAATCFKLAELGENWLGVFPLAQVGTVVDQRPWWLVAYRDGRVYEDRVILGDEDAYREVEERLSASGWNAVFTPPEWERDGTEALTLADIFSPRSGRALRSTSWLRANSTAIVLAILLMVAGTLGWLYWKDLQEQERLLELARQRQIEQENLRRLQVPPWIGTPEVEVFVRTCRAEVERSILFVAGWTQQDLTCTHDTGNVAFATTWQRSGGRIDWLLASINQRGFPATLGSSLESASLSKQIDLEKRADDRDAAAMEGAVLDRLLRIRFDNLSLNADLRQVVSRAAPQQARQQGVPIWNYHRLQFESSTPPDEYLRLISDLPAVVPEELSYNLTARRWTISMRIYHSPRGI